MNELFTVDYALNYEGWTYAKNIAPYNVYKLDEFIIKVRRNDFYLLLFIYNKCQELVFCGRIYTIRDYTVKIKRHLSKWKCKLSVNLNPSPSSQPPVILPRVINLSYAQGTPVPPTIIGEVFNETCFIIGGNFYNPILNLTYSLAGAYPNQYLRVSGIVQYTLGTFSNTILCRGLVSNTVFSTTINVTVYELPPSEDYFLILEDGDYILLENNDLILKE